MGGVKFQYKCDTRSLLGGGSHHCYVYAVNNADVLSVSAFVRHQNGLSRPTRQLLKCWRS